MLGSHMQYGTGHVVNQSKSLTFFGTTNRNPNRDPAAKPGDEGAFSLSAPLRRGGKKIKKNGSQSSLSFSRSLINIKAEEGGEGFRTLNASPCSPALSRLSFLSLSLPLEEN